jgi:hypothetical protein
LVHAAQFVLMRMSRMLMIVLIISYYPKPSSKLHLTFVQARVAEGWTSLLDSGR